MVDRKILALPAAPKALPTHVFPVVDPALSDANKNQKMTALQVQSLIGRPINVVSIADYGAVQDGVTDDTDAFIDALAAAGDIGIVWIPVTEDGTVISGGPIEMKPGQSVHSNGATIITGTGTEPCFSNMWDAVTGYFTGTEPWLKGLKFTPRLPYGAFVANTSAVRIGNANQSIHECQFANYDKPILYETNCWQIYHIDCLWGTNNYGVFWDGAITGSNSGASMYWERCGFDHNVVDMYLDPAVGKFHFHMCWYSLPAEGYLRALCNPIGDSRCHGKWTDCHFEAMSSVTGTNLRFTNKAMRLHFRDCRFCEEDVLLSPLFADVAPSFGYWQFDDARIDVAGSWPYLFDTANFAGNVIIRGGQRRYGWNSATRFHPIFSKIPNGDFELGTLAGWTEEAATVAVINTDAYFGTHCLSVSGVGASAKMANPILVPDGMNFVSINFVAKNVAGLNQAFPQAFLVNWDGTLGSAIQYTCTVAVTAGWQEYTIKLPLNRRDGTTNNLAGSFLLTFFLPSADTTGGEMRYDEFYVDFY